ncbi:hypothetical protein J5Y09_01660 [Roseomonas sp. PWR1]|uniref:AsmA-like C-terminal domain-containing protein n=1 Tax=Roseomonas nitratireducens TaxID=2820810 RepID=A0ABS4AMP6_9PROT|nr:hypothetical protein [Neoroseomonas nitratireducens]MBP0462606.1 hypothetical protein [Neoroseomonas nitratireducens]
MLAAGTIGARALALATVAGLALAAGPVLAQKGQAPGAAAPALPTAKPPPLGAPMQAQPAPRPAPPAAAPPAVAPSPRAPAPQAAIPANEPAAITRLRGVLGSDVRLSYGASQVLDGAGEQVRMTAVVMERGGERMTAEEVTIAGLREDGVGEAVIRGLVVAGGPDVRIAGLRIAGLTVPRGAGGPPDPAQVRLDTLRIEGVEATGSSPMRLRVASLENWIAGQPARFAMEGLEVGGLDAGFADTLRLARVALTGVDFGGTLAAVMRNEPPPSLVGTAALEIDRIEMLGGGRAVGALAEVRLAANITRTDGSGSGTLAFRGIRVEPLPMIADWLTRFGYQAVEADITADTLYDAPTGRIEIRDLSVAGRDAGTLSFAMVMDGVTQQRAQAADFSQMRLISMGLRYADASLFGRFVSVQAREARTPEPQLREQFAAMAGGALSQPGAAALDPIRDAIQRFIRGQAQTVEIRANPPQPIVLGQVQGGPPASPVEAQRMFGITAQAR